MEGTAVITDPLKSVVDFSFYRGVIKRSYTQTFTYIAYLGLIYSLAVVLSLVIHFKPRIQEMVDWASETIPEMTLAEGRLSSSAAGVTVLRHPDIPDRVVIVDTDRAAAVTPAEMAERKAVVFLTQNSVFILNNDRMEAYDLSKAQNKDPVTIDKAFYASLGSILTLVIFPIAFVLSWSIFLIWKHISALIYTLVALLINAGTGGSLEPSDLFKLSVYAQTPVIVLQIVALLVLKPIPLFRILAFIVVGVYLWQGIRQHISAEETERSE